MIQRTASTFSTTPRAQVLGVGVGSHSVFRTVCVTEFASSFTDFEGSGWDPANQPDRLPDRLASVTDDVVRCEGCANTIEGQGTRLDDGTQWHMGCLVCCDCERRLNGDFYERDGRWYCEACFRAVYLATMAADRAAAMEGVASGGGGGSGADPAPPAHICSVCSEPADDDGQRILLFGRKWHGACFACEVCQGQLSVDNARLIGDRVLCAPCSERPENVVGASSEIVFVDSANGLELSADTNLSVEKEGAATGATFGSQPGGRFQPTVGGRDPHAAPQASIFSIPPPGSTAARDRHLLNTDLTLSSPPLGSSSLGPPGRRSDRFLSGSPAAERGLGGSRLSAFGGATTGYASLGTFRSNLDRRSPPLGSTASLGDFKTGPWSASVFDRGSTVSGGLSWDTAGDQRDRQGSSAVGSEASMSTGSPARQRTNTLGWGGSLGGSLGGLGVMTAPRPPHDTLSASSARFSLGGLGSPMHSHVRARALPPSELPRQFGRFHTTRRNDWTSRPGQSPTRPSSPMIYRPMPGGIFGPIPHPSLDSPAQEGHRSPVRFASSPPERVFDNSARPSPARPASAEGNRLAVAAPEPRPVTSGGFQSLSGSLVTLKQRRPIVLTTASSPERTAPPPRPRGGPVAGEVIETVETYFGDGTQRGFFAQLQDDSALNGPRSPARRLRLDVRSDDRYAPRLSDLVRF